MNMAMMRFSEMGMVTRFLVSAGGSKSTTMNWLGSTLCTSFMRGLPSTRFTWPLAKYRLPLRLQVSSVVTAWYCTVMSISRAMAAVITTSDRQLPRRAWKVWAALRVMVESYSSWSWSRL